MPKINEFFNNKEHKQINSTFEELTGIRPCSSCELDVDGGWWDSENLIMKWTCSNGHETIHRVG
jgi:hypothetical protein